MENELNKDIPGYNRQHADAQKSGESTGMGFSQAERDAAGIDHKGSRYLVDKYNINDQAHEDSSLEDFVKTTSGFKHADDVNPDTNFNENPGGMSQAD